MDEQDSQSILIAKAVGGDQVALEQLLLSEYGNLTDYLASRLPVS